ncbi:MAG: hypothetical protein JRG81_00245 [Deltaproteobacteria bacterium]|nr:hypothetical protein [Deltaproteobacteria bacterium]MBW2363507.1 hypothetical protein [Deltaproteobacteria bacterium]
MKWTEQELIKLKNYYLNTHSDFFNLKELSLLLGRSKGATSHKATRLNITNPKRKDNIKEKGRAAKSMKKRIANGEQIKRFTGKQHTPEAKKNISLKKKQNWRNPKSLYNQDKYRQQLSDRFSGPKNHKQNPYSNARGGKRKDLNSQYFRSAWEANIARYLNFLLTIDEIKSWEYEPDTFWFEKIKRGVRSYTPDFKINNEYYIEVKGYMDDKSKTKLKRMAKYYPNIKIEILDENRYKKINKDFKYIIPFWEHGKKSKKSGKNRQKSPLESRRLQ